MDFKAQLNWLFHESFCLITQPAKFWHRKSTEEFAKPAFLYFFMPAVFLAGLAVALGEIIWSEEVIWSFVLLKALREVLAYTIQFLITASVLYKLMSNFKGLASRKALNSVLAYSLFPFVIASMITGLFPALYMLNIVGLYGFYLLVLGSQLCLDIPKENQVRFIILSILLIVLIFGTINIISWKIFQALFPYGA